jgi:hypothetical protein
MSRTLAAHLAIALLPAALAAAADAATYYVATDGKPANDGSREKPWPAVEFALAKVGGGNKIVLRPGVYRGPITIARIYSGTEQRPTVIQSEEKWKAVIVGSPVHCITSGDDCQWLAVDGFEVLGARYDGVKLYGRHNAVRNCWVHHNTQIGIAMHGARDSVIENNLIEFNGCHVQFHHGVYADGDGLTVRGNIVRHNAGFGLHLYPALRNSLVALNLVYGHPYHQGLIVSCPKGGGRNRVLQNTIAENQGAIVVWNGDGETIANNILVAAGETISLELGSRNLEIDYNLCRPKSPHSGPYGVGGDPLLLDPRHGLFWLKPQSAAIGRGSGKYALEGDFWGRPAPPGRAPDLGAFAFVPALLDPQSRATWYLNWAYGYPPHGVADAPDFWSLPSAARVERN